MRLKKTLFVVLASLITTGISAQVKYPFQNPSLSNKERVENLLSLLTPDEKVGLMMNTYWYGCSFQCATGV